MDASQFRNQLERMWATRPVRPASPRTVAGVCVGIAERYRVDPTLVKVAFVVATVFGGSGLLLYVAAWIACPSAPHARTATDTPAAGRHSGKHGNPSKLLLLVVIAVFVTSIGSAGRWGSGGLVGVILMLLGWWLLYLRTPEPPTDTSLPSLVPTAAPDRFARWTPRAVRAGAVTSTAHVSTTAASETMSQPKAGATSQPGITLTKTSVTDAPSVPSGTDLDRTPPAWDPLGTARFAWDLPEPTTPQPPAPLPQRRSPLGLIVIGLAVIVGAIGAALHQAGITWFSVGHIAALALAVVGGGLIVGGLTRRESGRHASGLVPVAMALGAAVVIVTTLVNHSAGGSFTVPAGGVGERNWKPLSENDIRGDYTLSAGQLTLDLRSVNLTSDRTVNLRNGAGEINIKVPANMNIRTNCSSTMGEFNCPEGLSGGNDGTSGPVLTINAHTSMGQVEVTR